MARERTSLPRKKPLQERSRATVEAILDAAARVLVERGFEGGTTNRIAEVAGVSVGSLYQYFPNKSALLGALLERHLRSAEATRPAELRVGAGDVPLATAIRAAVDWHLAAHAAEPALHHELTIHAPRVVGAAALREVERGHRAAVEARLARHRDEIRPRNTALAAFLVSTCLEAVTHAAVVHHPEWLGEPELAEELSQMLLRYLEDTDRGSGAS